MKKTGFVLAALAAAAAAGTAAAVELETGVEFFGDPATKIEALNRFYLGVPVAEGLTLGQSIYSGAAGDGGGAFFWGFEAVKRVPLTQDLSLSFSGFAGGGGGATAVAGDGTMFRAGAALDYDLPGRWALQAGVSRIHIDGADIDDWAAGLGLAYRLEDKDSNPGRLRPRLRSVSMAGSAYRFPDTLNRSGSAQSDLKLAGVEASFLTGSRTEAFFNADGAVSGGDGYMQIFGGYRARWQAGPVDLIGQARLGFGGGGDVDTGGGVLTGVSAGIAIPVTKGADFEVLASALHAPSSGVTGTGVQARISRVFNRKQDARPSGKPVQWQFTFGLSAMDPNDTFMKSRDNSGISPVMQESSVDLFLTDSLYLTGNGQTTVHGGVAGFAIGLLGLGYEVDLNDTWRAAVEGHIGAAGGGGVDVGDGLIGGLRAEIDYKISEQGAVSLGAGMLRVRGGGMDVPVLQIGYKHRFTTR